ncbi:MAG: type II toxin-antitoxin system HicB family antitoxin [Acidobacteriota bacterium]|nr:type II toxin-antitoxin system HicB family antitoxin [Acidobacteriota bacterium]
MNIKVIVEKGEDGYFVAHVPALKSCWSQGRTREEARENIKEAIVLYLEPELAALNRRTTVENPSAPNFP